MQEIILDMDEIREMLPRRVADSHKGSVGRVLVVAGSRGMTGAAILASKAVLRGGAGLVTLAAPSYLSDMIDVFSTEVMTFPLPMTNTGSISREALGTLQQLLPRFDAVLIGPGLSGNKNTLQLVADLLKTISRDHPEKKVILDADGLKVLKKALRPYRMPLIITPHIGELAKILGKYSTKEISAKPYFYAKKIADKLNCIVVLKSNRTCVIGPRDNKYFLNINGNPGLATAGSGDVLAGLVAGLWVSSKNITPLKAAVASPFVHGIAGNIAAGKRSVDGIIASDVLEEIPTALRIIKGA